MAYVEFCSNHCIRIQTGQIDISMEFEVWCWNYLWNGSQFINSLSPSDAYMPHLTNHHWFRWWLVAWSVPSHYLNQCWNVVNWTPRNQLQWNRNRDSYIFFQENAFENASEKRQQFCFILSILFTHFKCHIVICRLQNGSHFVLTSTY